MVTLFERSEQYTNVTNTKAMVCTPVFMCKKQEDTE